MESRKENLLFIPTTFTNGGGAEKILQILVNNLPLERYNITIQEVERYNHNLKLKDGIKLNLAFRNQKGIAKSFNDLNHFLLLHKPQLLKTIFKLDKYDAVITYNYQLPSFMLPAFENEKKIAWFHSDIYDLNASQIDWEKIKQHNVWDKADKIVSISNKSYKSLKDIFPDFVNKTEIIHNGMNFNEVISKSREALSDNLDKENYIICIGRIDERKNFSLAVNALYELLKDNINIKLVIVGTGNLYEDIRKQAIDLGILNNIVFTGFQDNPYKYLCHSKILCVTSLSEGWPTVIMEAMALGIPFVTTPVAGASEELSDNGKCGIVVDYNPSEYAEAVKKLLTNQSLYEQMSKNCKENVKQYSAEKYAENFIRLLNNIEKNNDTIVNKNHKNTILNIIQYFFLYILSVGEIINRTAIIKKRIREKRLVKVIKNTIYLLALILLLPISLIWKIILFPIYVHKVRVYNK